jgi:hypothetical protein
MKLNAFKQHLAEAGSRAVRFELPSGVPVAPHAHVTEVARIDKRFIDCGGTLRTDSLCRLQTWVADDVAHRLHADKLLGILNKAASVLGTDGENLDVDVEHEEGVISQYPIHEIHPDAGSVLIRLGRRHTACLAPELCVPATPVAISIGFGRKSPSR